MNATVYYYSQNGYLTGGLYKVKNCLCPDGRRRTVFITAEADTFFSIPARVSFKNTTVTGFVTGRVENGEKDYEFIPYQNRKNAKLFGEIK